MIRADVKEKQVSVNVMKIDAHKIKRQWQNWYIIRLLMLLCAGQIS